MEKIDCLVCGNKTLSKRGIFEVCPVCFWEDEGEIADPSQPTGGPNGDLSLNAARENYHKIGAVESKFLKNVRKATTDEQRKV